MIQLKDYIRPKQVVSITHSKRKIYLVLREGCFEVGVEEKVRRKYRPGESKKTLSLD